MKILITYFSRSGNTEKVAKAIYEEVQCSKDIMQITLDMDLEQYDYVFLGFPIESYGPPKDIYPFLRTKTQNSKLILFITHGVPENNELVPSWIDKCKTFLHPTANVVDIFTCQGEVADYVVDELSQSQNPMLRAWAKHCYLLKGQPDEAKLQKTKKITQKILKEIK